MPNPLVLQNAGATFFPYLPDDTSSATRRRSLNSAVSPALHKLGEVGSVG